MSYAPGPRTVEREIPDGDRGTEITVATMAQLARAATRHDLCLDTAAGIVGRAGSEPEAAHRIRDFLEDHVVFRYDPPGVELIRTPRAMLRDIELDGETWGDCDDVATLGAALGMAAGIPARFVLLGFTRAGPFEHVYTELLTDRGPVELDTTRPAQMPAGIRVFRTGQRGV